MIPDISAELLEIDSQTYGRLFDGRVPVYLSQAFNQLHVKKSDVKFLQISCGKTKFGLVAGIRDERLLSPISAPFGGLWPLRSSAGVDAYESAIETLMAYARSQGVREMQLTLAPLFYDNNNLSRCVSAFCRGGFAVPYIDLNHHFQISKFDFHHTSHLGSSARRHLKLGVNAAFGFHVCRSDEQRRQAYDLIRESRTAKGIPLRMTLENLMDTARVLPVEFFIAGRGPEASASAIVYHVYPGVAQVIYWGDRLDHRSHHPMYFLAHHLLEFYREKQFAYLDLGISTVDGQPNLGLCAFKEGLGFDVSLKYTFTCSL